MSLTFTAPIVGRDANRRRRRNPWPVWLLDADDAARAALRPLLRLAVLCFSAEARAKRRSLQLRTRMLYSAIALQGELGGLTTEPTDATRFVTVQRHDSELLMDRMAVQRAQRQIARNRERAPVAAKVWWR